MSEIKIREWTEAWARSYGLRVWSVVETSSTNSVAKEDADHQTVPVLAAGAVISLPSLYLASVQTAGRGRGDHRWETPAGASLLSSWSFSLARSPQPCLSPQVGLALFEAAAQTWPSAHFNLKAPNDLYIRDRKVAGLLIETVDSGRERRTVIGLGFNVASSPPEVPTATCLIEALSLNEKNGAAFEAQWSQFLDRWLENLQASVVGGLNTKMEPAVTERLREALNLHPLLKEPVLRVDELGQLHSKSGITHWHEL